MKGTHRGGACSKNAKKQERPLAAGEKKDSQQSGRSRPARNSPTGKKDPQRRNWGEGLRHPLNYGSAEENEKKNFVKGITREADHF